MNRVKEEHDVMEKKQERVIAFFDAVLAIAITIMALEIKFPNLGQISMKERYEFFTQFTAYFISFIALGSLWYFHADLFSRCKGIGSKSILVLHLLLMFPVALFPAMTESMAMNQGSISVMFLYIFTFILLQVVLLLIFFNVINQTRKMENSKNMVIDYIRSAIDTASNDKKSYEALQMFMKMKNDTYFFESFSDKLPEEYLELYEEAKRKWQINYKLSLYSVSINMIFIIIAVIALAFNPIASYVVLGVGVIVDILLMPYIKRRLKNTI